MKSISVNRFAGLFLLMTLLLGAAILPGLAQDSTVTVSADSLTIVTGAVSFSPTGDIMVAGITIAPAGAFNPSILHEGDLVIITGIMLNDTTLQAVAFEFFDDEQQPEVTPEPTVEVTPEATMESTPEATPEATPESTPESAPDLTGCNVPNQPVAMRIAETFEVSYDDVMALHCQGIGFGNIIRAFVLAENSTDGSTAEDYLDRHANGEGWGQIMRDSDIHPSDLAPGQVLKHHDDAVSGENTSQPGNNGGNGHGNGNGGGNGNGHGNGGGNGNGSGNGHGNGGGNGHGNGG